MNLQIMRINLSLFYDSVYDFPFADTAFKQPKIEECTNKKNKKDLKKQQNLGFHEHTRHSQLSLLV